MTDPQPIFVVEETHTAGEDILVGGCLVGVRHWDEIVIKQHYEPIGDEL